ncbi:MAG: hypothetical protein U9Q69_05215 [Nanoarchaeota archaeon]|nr:hypothetical protein [Nanoarchaeota archaeon]
MRCIVCKKLIPKGSKRGLCSEHSNPIGLFKPIALDESKGLSGKSPNIFIGSYGYPHVNVSILSLAGRPDDAWLYDAPNFWGLNSFGKKSIIALRSSLLGSRFQASVKKKKNKFLEIAQELSMAAKPVSIDIKLAKKPVFKLNFNNIAMPSGPRAELKSAKLAENPKILPKIDKAVCDTDLNAADAMSILYSKGISEHSIIKLLSAGNLGIGAKRKLVPTKWSITAAHDSLGKFLIKKIKDYKFADYECFFGEYLGNYFLIMLLPDAWAFELFETYLDGKMNYTTDFESYDGRKGYASNCVGGYYSARLGVLEKLNFLKKQASVLAIRLISREYDVPLGVWVVLEAVRKALGSKKFSFDNLEDMTDYIKKTYQIKFNIEFFFKKSRILSSIKNQKKLDAFYFCRKKTFRVVK